MAQVKIRKPEVSESAAIAALLRDSIKTLCVQDHANDAQKLASWVKNKTAKQCESWIQSDEMYCCCAARQDEIVGFAMLSNKGVLHLLYLDPNYIGLGIGQQLLEAIERIAIDNSITKIYLESTKAAKVFYEKNHYKNDQSFCH